MTNIIATKAGASVPAIITLAEKRGEARVDSRLIAQTLDTKHQSTFELVKRYQTDLEAFGLLPFQTGKANGGRPEKFALLNEDQAFFLLTLSKNTKRVVELKLKLVKAFNEARRAAELHTEYLPTYHGLHDQMHRLAAGSPNERWVHVNMNKMVNKVAGVEAGQRAHACVPQKALLIAAQHIAAQAMQGAADHHEAHARAKAALAPLMPHPMLTGAKYSEK